MGRNGFGERYDVNADGENVSYHARKRDAIRAAEAYSDQHHVRVTVYDRMLHGGTVVARVKAYAGDSETIDAR